MSWLYLFGAGLAEIGWAVGLKYSDGFSKPAATLATVAAIAASLGLLGLALRELPLGTAYAVWTGLGTIGTAIVGILAFGETAAPLRLACIAVIAIGILGLQWGAGS